MPKEDKVTFKIGGNAKSGKYQQYRDQIQLTYDLLAGYKPLNETEDHIYIYTYPTSLAPSYTLDTSDKYIHHITFSDEEDGYIYTDPKTGKIKKVYTFSSVEQKLDFLRTISNRLNASRIEVTVSSNQQLEQDRSVYSAPGGFRGHLIKEFDALLEQLKQEYYHHRNDKQLG